MSADREGIRDRARAIAEEMQGFAEDAPMSVKPSIPRIRKWRHTLLALLDTESEPRLLFKDWPRRDADQSYALLDMDTTYPCTVTAMRAPDGSLVYQVTPPESEPVAHVTAIVDDDGLIADLDYLLPRELWAPEGDMVAVPLYTHPVGRAPAERDERYTLDEIEAAVDAAEVRYDPCYDGRTMCGLVTEELGRLRATPTETGGEG